MTADETRLRAGFIQWDIPAKKQTDLEPRIRDGEVVRMDRTHVVFTALNDSATRLFNGDKFDYILDEQGEGVKDFPARVNNGQQTVRVNRKILIKLLENMDSDTVDIRVCALYPLYIRGLIGDELASAGIAPIIEETDYEQESEKTRV